MRHLHRTLLVAIGLLLVSTAWAQQTPPTPDDLFKPGSGDLASSLLDTLFGVTAGASAPVNAFAAALQVLNWGSLLFGCLMFSFMVVVGTIRTAEDGELLGKKWSSVWVPLRFTAVCALMVPMASGYSTAQVGVLWLAKAGSSLASNAWTAAASHLAGGGDRMAATFNSPAYKQSLDAAMRRVLKAEACAAGFRQTNAFLGDGVKRIGMSSVRLSDGSYLARWGDAGAPDDGTLGDLGIAIDQCGSVQGNSPPAPDAVERTLTMSDGMGGTTDVATQPAGYDATIVQLVLAAEDSGLRVASRVLGPVAARMVSKEPAPPGAQSLDQAINQAVADAGAAYTATVMPAVESLWKSAVGGDRLMRYVTQPGWLLAGTTMYTMARIEGEIKTATVWTPAVVPPSTDTAGALGVGAETGASDVYSSSWDRQMEAGSRGAARTTGRALAQWITRHLAGDPRDQTHMLIQLKDAGDDIMTWTQVSLAAVGILNSTGGTIAKAATSVAGAVGKFIPGADAVSSLFSGAAWGGVVLFVCGIVMSLVLPAVPYVLWMGSIAGWLICVAQALAATPIWMAAHLHPEGDDLAGKGSAGYMVLLEVAMRPAFMVIGLAFSLKLVDVMLRLNGYAYWAMVDQVQADSWTGVVSIVTLVIICVGLTWTIVRTCFGLIHDLPSTVMRWIGGAHAVHDKGEQFGGTAQGQINQGLGRAEPLLVKGMSSAARGVRLSGKSGGGASERSPLTLSDGGHK